MFATLFDKFGRKARSLEAKERLVHAYKNVFAGRNPSQEDQQLVLADLANVCSFRRVCPPTVTDAELRFVEGSRAAFGRVLEMIELAPTDLEALAQAARREAAADQYATQPSF